MIGVQECCGSGPCAVVPTTCVDSLPHPHARFLHCLSVPLPSGNEGLILVSCLAVRGKSLYILYPKPYAVNASLRDRVLLATPPPAVFLHDRFRHGNPTNFIESYSMLPRRTPTTMSAERKSSTVSRALGLCSSGRRGSCDPSHVGVRRHVQTHCLLM